MRERGQATVELALVLPLVAGILLVLVQVGLVVRDQVLTAHAAREAVRAAAVDDRPGAARSAAVDGSGLDAERLTVRVGPRGRPGSRVRVEVAYRAPTDVPLVGPLVGEVTLTAAATMRVEQ
jgi:Flp pilus assembly protein TadG